MSLVYFKTKKLEEFPMDMEKISFRSLKKLKKKKKKKNWQMLIFYLQNQTHWLKSIRMGFLFQSDIKNSLATFQQQTSTKSYKSF